MNRETKYHETYFLEFDLRVIILKLKITLTLQVCWYMSCAPCFDVLPHDSQGNRVDVGTNNNRSFELLVYRNHFIMLFALSKM